MTEDANKNQTGRPSIFSRGSLQLTYDVLRHENAQLALQVRNIMGSEPLPKAVTTNNTKISDQFRVDLDSFQVRAVVEGMVAQELLASDPGKAIMIKALIQDWMALAEKMINELPDDQKP